MGRLLDKARERSEKGKKKKKKEEKARKKKSGEGEKKKPEKSREDKVREINEFQSREIAQSLISVFEFILKSEIMMTGEFDDDIPDEFFTKYGALRDEYLSDDVMEPLPIELKQVEEAVFSQNKDKLSVSDLVG